MQSTFGAEPESWAQHQVGPQVPADAPLSLQTCSCPISLLDWEFLHGRKSQRDEEIADRWGKQGQGCDWGFAVQLTVTFLWCFPAHRSFQAGNIQPFHSIWNQADVTFRESQNWCHQNTAWSNQANVEFCLESLSGLSTVWNKKKIRITGGFLFTSWVTVFTHFEKVIELIYKTFIL